MFAQKELGQIQESSEKLASCIICVKNNYQS